MSDAAAAPAFIDLKGMGLEGLFRPDGHPYRMLPEAIENLPAFYRQAATDVWRVLVKHVREAKGDLDERLITRDIAEEIRVKQLQPGEEGYEADHRSESHVYKGLYALEKICKLIVRIHTRGRRLIRFVKGLLGSKRDEKKKKNDNVPLVDVVSSSSNPKDGAGETPAEELPADLVEAVGLLPDLSHERLNGWVRAYGVELARKAVAWVRIWLKHPRPEKRPRGAFWAEKALRDWKKRLDAGELAPADIDAEIAAKVDRWDKAAAVPKKAPAVPVAEPVRPLTAEEVADLVVQAGRRQGGQIALKALKAGIEEGAISPELAATIPPELLRRE